MSWTSPKLLTRAAVALVFIVSSLIVATPLPAAADTATITGTVTDDSDDAPLSGIFVGLFNSSGQQETATTSSDGTYALEGVAAGDYTLVFSDPDRPTIYRDVSRQVTVVDGSSSTEDAQLPAGGYITGRIIDAATRAPLPDAVIYDPGGGKPRAEANSNGGFSVSRIAAQQGFALTYVADGYLERTLDYDISPGTRITNLTVTLGTPDPFNDVAPDSTFGENIAALAGSGITKGCNPPDNDEFCPDDFVTRAEMAAFLDRGLGLPDAQEQFRDVTNDNVFRANIGALAGVGITKGCNPPDNDEFCPDDFVTRAEMAAFLDRAGLTG